MASTLGPVSVLARPRAVDRIGPKNRWQKRHTASNITLVATRRARSLRKNNVNNITSVGIMPIVPETGRELHHTILGAPWNVQPVFGPLAPLPGGVFDNTMCTGCDELLHVNPAPLSLGPVGSGTYYMCGETIDLNAPFSPLVSMDFLDADPDVSAVDMVHTLDAPNAAVDGLIVLGDTNNVPIILGSDTDIDSDDEPVWPVITLDHGDNDVLGDTPRPPLMAPASAINGAHTIDLTGTPDDWTINLTAEDHEWLDDVPPAPIQIPGTPPDCRRRRPRSTSPVADRNVRRRISF